MKIPDHLCGIVCPKIAINVFQYILHCWAMHLFWTLLMVVYFIGCVYVILDHLLKFAWHVGLDLVFVYIVDHSTFEFYLAPPILDT